MSWLKLKDQEKRVLKKLDNEKKKWNDEQKLNKKPVSVEDVYEMISDTVGVPINKLDTKESKNLLNENLITKKVIGQEDIFCINHL